MQGMARNGRFVLSFAFVLAIWWLSSGTLFVKEIVPSPDDVAAMFVDLTVSGELFNHIYASFKRILSGYGIGVCIGYTLGLFVGSNRTVRTIFEPLIEFFRNVPPVALIPLVVSLFGIGETGKYFIIAYAATFVMVINTAAGEDLISISNDRSW